MLAPVINGQHLLIRANIYYARSCWQKYIHFSTRRTNGAWVDKNWSVTDSTLVAKNKKKIVTIKIPGYYLPICIRRKMWPLYGSYVPLSSCYINAQIWLYNSYVVYFSIGTLRCGHDKKPFVTILFRFSYIGYIYTPTHTQAIYFSLDSGVFNSGNIRKFECRKHSCRRFSKEQG